MSTSGEIDAGRNAARAAVAHLSLAGQLTALVHAVDHTIADNIPRDRWDNALELAIKQLLEGIHLYHPNRGAKQ